MQKNLPTLDPTDKGLFFLSLGGIGEIGANCYLYGCDGKWIMIDLGLSFADEQFPGIDLLVPKIDFVPINLKEDINIYIPISKGCWAIKTPCAAGPYGLNAKKILGYNVFINKIK